MRNHNNHSTITLPREVLEIVNILFQKEGRGEKKARSIAKKDLNKYCMKTADGSFTLCSEEVNGVSEAMHTHHGALEESRQKFVKPSLIDEKLQLGRNVKGRVVKILDICSGLGYNAAAALEMGKLKERSISSNKIQIDMVEISREILAMALLIPSPINSHKIVKRVIEDWLLAENYLSFKFEKSKIPENVGIEVHCQDARIFVKDLINKNEDINKNSKTFGHHHDIKGNGVYDAIFLDPFSPQITPELYTMDFFKSLRQVIKNDGVLLTYTSAAPVRSGMVKAGFHLGEVSSFGRKKGSTKASVSLKNIAKDLSSDDERMIALSDAGLPFQDPQLDDNGFSIAKKRHNQRKVARDTFKIASTVKTPLYLRKNLPEGRLKRRVIRNLQVMGLDHPYSKKALFLICPQYDACICGCGCATVKGSRDRIKEMEKRLNKISCISLIDDFE